MLAWYLVYAKPRQERTALVNLDRQGYETYLPLIRVRRRRAGELAQMVEPMFPRYLFIHLSTETDNWGPIRSTIGVTGLVRFGADAAIVPDALIEELRERADDKGVQTEAAKGFAKGDRVQIGQGVLAGYEAVFDAQNSRNRVSVLLDIAGRQTRIVMHPDDLDPI